MKKKYSHKALSAFSMAILVALTSVGWAEESAVTAPAKVPENPQTVAHLNKARQISKEKQQQLVKQAVEVVMETENALTALNEKKSKEAFRRLNNVSAKLRNLLAKDSQLKLVPVSFQEQTFIFEGGPDKVKETVSKASDLIKEQRIQQAKQLLDSLTSEIRINVVELPLGEYPAAIDKASSLISDGNDTEAKNILGEVLDKLVTHLEIYPLPVLAAETDLTEAFELEHKSDLKKPEDKAAILELADKAQNQLKLAEALGYGEKKDYEVLYEGIQALRDTLHTDKFAAEWEKVKTALTQLKEKVIHPLK